MQHPLLYMGLIGFDAASEEALRCWLTHHAMHAGDSATEHPIWQLVDYREADALLIRGAGVAQGFGTQLQFLPALQASQPNAPLGLDLAAMKLPFAISDVDYLQALGITTKDRLVFNTVSVRRIHIEVVV